MLRRIFRLCNVILGCATFVGMGISEVIALPSNPSTQPQLKVYPASELYVEGLVAFSNLNYGGAIASLEQALKANSDPGIEQLIKLSMLTIYKVQGNTYVEGLPEEAIQALTKAIELQPNDAFLYARRGDAYCELQQVQECLSNHNQSIKVNPNKGEAYSRRAQAYLKIGNRAAAIEDYKRSVQAYQKAGQQDSAETTARILKIFESGLAPD